MALEARQMPITREDVAGWLEAYDPGTGVPLKDYIEQKVDALQLSDPYVDVGSRDDISGQTVPVLELIMADLPSYGWTENGKIQSPGN